MGARLGAMAGAALSALLVGSAARAENTPPPAADDPTALKAQVEALSASTASLRAAVSDLENKASSPSPIRFSGYVQIDWVLADQASQDQIDPSTGQPLNQDRFTLRRGHLRVDAEHGLLAGVLEIDANTTQGPQVRPIDAEVIFRWPEGGTARDLHLVAALGLMRIPFGFEVQELDYVRPFLERAAVARALFPGEFDLGARIGIRYRAFDWTLAVMNGSPIGDAVFPALAPGKTKELVGRIGTQGDLARGVHFEAGVSGDTGLGFHAGTPTTKDVLIWHDDNGDGIVQSTEISVIPGSPATPSQQFTRFAIGADARLRVQIAPIGELALRAEIMRGKNLDRGIEVADPVGAGHDLRELGWSLGASQEVTPWAMVGVRYDEYNPDQDASEQQGPNLVPIDRTYRTLALMAMLRYDRGRLVFEYDKNGNPLGRAANGSPATLADDAVTLRGQVVF
ncbi:MAG TPA: hypothetical protein VK841_07340 [Polyangiaceae bacterium]|jgi:hypothetical protein|nr:hypothetical protein [Polyangiaceae bacterium]